MKLPWVRRSLLEDREKHISTLNETIDLREGAHETHIKHKSKEIDLLLADLQKAKQEIEGVSEQKTGELHEVVEKVARFFHTVGQVLEKLENRQIGTQKAISQIAALQMYVVVDVRKAQEVYGLLPAEEEGEEDSGGEVSEKEEVRNEEVGKNTVGGDSPAPSKIEEYS